MPYHFTAQRFTRLQMDENRRSVRTAVLRVVRSQGSFTFRDLISRLGDNLDEASIKAAVFRLSSEGQIEISPEWKVSRIGRPQK